MIEKIFIVFCIMEAFGLVLHILDTIRCWSDRKYYRKNKKVEQKNNDRVFDALEQYRKITEALNFVIADLTDRIEKLENKKEIEK